ncbi:hypothetical protein CF326_g8514, partial [Tilletia indica]
MEGAKRLDISREWTAHSAIRLSIDEQASQATCPTDSESEASNTVGHQGKAMRPFHHPLTSPRTAQLWETPRKLLSLSPTWYTLWAARHSLAARGQGSLLARNATLPGGRQALGQCMAPSTELEQ